MTDIDALRLVRNMAYEFDETNVLHDLVIPTGHDPLLFPEKAHELQTKAIDIVDRLLFNLPLLGVI